MYCHQVFSFVPSKAVQLCLPFCYKASTSFIRKRDIDLVSISCLIISIILKINIFNFLLNILICCIVLYLKSSPRPMLYTAFFFPFGSEREERFHRSSERRNNKLPFAFFQFIRHSNTGLLK